MKFISAGHCATKGPNYDPGAQGNKRGEAIETLRVRNRVIQLIKERGYTDIIQDADGESLREYLLRIKPGNASVVVEFHFNAFNGKATGVECVIGEDGDRLDRALATDLTNVTACILGLPKRSGGVITESQTHRGRLGLMRETGIVVLVEVCFIDNPDDMAKYDANFETLCSAYADIIIKYDNLIT
jgi:N-acetylmuramoyl-L-alanine amidase